MGSIAKLTVKFVFPCDLKFPLLYPKRSNLSLMEKNQLMRFFKLVQGHLVATVGAGTSGNEILTSKPSLY